MIMHTRIVCLAASLGVVGWLAVAAAAQTAGDEASIRQIRFSSGEQTTRVVIETAGRLAYRTARLRDPDRIYFDLEGSMSKPGARVIQVGSSLLKRIRVSERASGVTRVVLDIEPGVEPTITRLNAPDRLVIDLRHTGSVPAPELAFAKRPESVAEPAAAPIPTPAPEPSPAPVATPTPAFEPVATPTPAQPTPVAAPAPVAAPEPAPAAVTVAEPAPAAALPKAEGGSPIVVEEIVAKINNEIITSSEIAKYRGQLQTEIARQQMSGDRARQAMQQAETDLLRDRIDQLLLIQKGKELDIKVDQDLSKQLAQIQLKSGLTDPDKFQQWVRDQSGSSFEDFRQQMKDNLLTQEVVRREVGQRISISRAEAQKYYEDHKNDFVREDQVWLQEILISTQGKDSKGVEAAEKKANDLVTRARKGENFATLARDNSDAETAENGGSLPAFKHGLLRKEIEDVVFKESKGYVTDPYRQANGFLILKVVQHDSAGLQPFESVEGEVMDRLYGPRMQPAMRAYLTKLRQEAYLQIRAGYVDSGAAPGKDTSWQQAAKLKPPTVTKEEVAERTRRKRLMFMVPIPGTEKRVGISSSTGNTTIPTK